MKGNPWCQNRLRNFGAKRTIARQLVLEILQKTDEHLSAEEIFMEAHKNNPSIGLTTVYRTLELYTQMGITQKFDFGDKKARYELTENPEGKKHHHHLVCMRCCSIIDYDDFVDEEEALVRKTEKKLSEKYDFKITGHMLRFYGICGTCREKESAGLNG